MKLVIRLFLVFGFVVGASAAAQEVEPDREGCKDSPS